MVMDLKIHADIIEDFTLDFATKLKQICEDNNILILEIENLDNGHILKNSLQVVFTKILN